MFSSNQIFDVSCEPSDLARVIKFGIELYGDDMFIRSDGRVHIAFSEPAPRHLCHRNRLYGPTQIRTQQRLRSRLSQILGRLPLRLRPRNHCRHYCPMGSEATSARMPGHRRQRQSRHPRSQPDVHQRRNDGCRSNTAQLAMAELHPTVHTGLYDLRQVTQRLDKTTDLW